MADNGENKKSSGIGELFVEFGVKGFGTMLKSLNAVSASFLLVKNAGQQFAQMLTKPIKESGNAAVAIGKMSSALGITMKEAMKLQRYFEKHNLSESLIGDLTGISDMLTKVQLGIGGISGEFAYAMHKMGLNWQDYDGSMESMIKLTNDVKKATAGMDANTKRVMMKAVGLQPEWSYAFERGDFNLADYKAISDKEIEELIKNQEALNDAKAAIKALTMHLTDKLTPAITTVADWISGKADEAAAGTYDKDINNFVDETINTGKDTVKAFSNAKKVVDTGMPGWLMLPAWAAYGLDERRKRKKAQKKGQTTGGAANLTPELLSSANLIETPIDLTPLPKGYKDTLPNLNLTSPEMLAPSNTSNMMQNNNVQITNNNTINGANSESIGGRITALSADSYNQALSQYQTMNRAQL